MQKNKKKYILFLFLFIVTTANTQPELAKPTQTTLFSFLSTATEEKIQQSTLYLKANYFQHSGQFHQALKIYNDLFIRDAPSYVYDGYLRLLSQTNQFNRIVSLIDKTQDNFKENLEIQLIYAQSLLNTNKDIQAREFLEKLKEQYPENEQIAYYSAAHNERTNNISKALEEIEAFLTNKSNQNRFFLFYFLKAKILLKIGNPKQALAAIDSSLKLAPKFDQGVLFKALLLEQTKQIDQAIAHYRKYLSLTKHDPAITKQLVQLLFSQRKFAQAAAELRKINQENRDQPEYYTDLALLEWKAKNHVKALNAINEALNKSPLFEKAIGLKIEICIALNQYEEIAPLIQNWLLKKPHNNSIIKLILRLSGKEQIISSEQAIAILEAANKKHDTLDTIPLAIADLQIQAKQYNNALKSYDQAFKRTNSKKLKAKLLFQTGFIHFVTDNKQEATKTLDRALQQEVIYPSTYNLMAYLISKPKKQSSTKLSYALTLIDKALATTPQSPYFLDTKACILQKQGKYNEAKELFNKALTLAPHDKIIQSHAKTCSAK
ncbi:tetratricopeptide repeat protein [Candidatus Dependentiae bacterium]|nr:tetratricopeptide repeat protein [Candidatus Dependentiae bacterium]